MLVSEVQAALELSSHLPPLSLAPFREEGKVNSSLEASSRLFPSGPAQPAPELVFQPTTGPTRAVASGPQGTPMYTPGLHTPQREISAL